MPKTDVTVFQPNPFLVDIASDDDTQMHGYLADGYKTSTFNIGRTSDTGPGDVGDTIINPPDNYLIDNPGFPALSIVTYEESSSYKRMDVRLEGSVERPERIGAFSLEAVAANGESEKIITIKTASQGIWR